MMLAEAATRAGVMSSLPLLGRPTCMALPATLASGTATSTGCIGNRVYTGLAEGELYVTLRATDLERVAAEIDTILSANQALTTFIRNARPRLRANRVPEECLPAFRRRSRRERRAEQFQAVLLEDRLQPRAVRRRRAVRLLRGLQKTNPSRPG